jgi:hypothetical protein
MVPLRPLTARLAACGAILVLSALYYGTYAMAGFNYADDGNYAQIAYELALGRNIHDLAVNYGLLWFKLGEWLFRLFGVDFALVRGLFFACIAATNLLVFAAVLSFGGSLPFALAVTAVPLLVPAFPATAFYGLCVTLNAAAQMRLARRLPSCRPLDAGLAGAALALTFLIRPDFGFVFAAPLMLIVALSGSGRRRPVALAAAVGFLAALAPVAAAGAAGGYLDLIVQPFLDYPRLMIDYATGGLHRLLDEDDAAAVTAAATFLERPGLRAIFRADTAAFALLVYLPLLGLAGFATAVGLTLPRRIAAGRRDRLAQAAVAFCAALAALPHYFLFRPDMSHIANFMPGFMLMAAFLLCRLPRILTTAPARAAGGALAAVLLLNAGLYVAVGLRSGATGGIGIAAERTEDFTARNGVAVKVAPAELAQLEALRAAIEAHSAAGDRIVCLPYCPGLAFMTARRMLLGTFYADDSFPLRTPHWIADTIAATRAARPPLVIVMDLAINGTEASRFGVWARAYVDAVAALAVRTIPVPGGTVYVLGPEPQGADPQGRT